MPYTANDPNLPKHVKAMPVNKRKRWSAVWNSVYKRCLEKGGKAKDCEEQAFKTANGLVKK